MTAGIDTKNSRTLRQAIREGRFRKPTAACAPDKVQCNVVILPSALAQDFARFCALNAQACPLLATTERGSPYLPTLGRDIDLRTDIPRYRILRRGRWQESVHNILKLWRDDFVGFALGCSFSFEEALLGAGIELRHHSLGCNVPMYRTQARCHPSGVFEGNLVVSMRPMTEKNAIRASNICKHYPKVHGPPIQIGNPEKLGIRDLNCPDFGDPVIIESDELPVFWACGVTPQLALENASPNLAIVHSPGHMLITDLENSSLYCD